MCHLFFFFPFFFLPSYSYPSLLSNTSIIFLLTASPEMKSVKFLNSSY